MEAVKNRLTGVVRNAGALVIDADPHFVPDPGDRDFDQPSSRRKADGIVDDRIDGAGQPIGLPHYDRAVLPRSGEGKPRVAGFAPRFPAVDELFDERPQVDTLEPRPRELGIGSGSLADIADQSVEP